MFARLAESIWGKPLKLRGERFWPRKGASRHDGEGSAEAWVETDRFDRVPFCDRKGRLAPASAKGSGDHAK
ncbi:hypothetical protein DB347_12185 [Opitutaceae bacterium EW11]|nr:hypothetical protein DB347_12185 [Opitutaceae bacterium EW11]